MISDALKKIMQLCCFESMLLSRHQKSFPVAKMLRERLELLQREDRPVKVQIGCGPRILKEWINIDLKYEPYGNYLKFYTEKFYPPEIRGSLYDFFPLDVISGGIPLPDESVDVIFHEDFIEHLNQREQIVFLSEALRILKKGGIHRINSPNLLISMVLNSKFNKGIDGVYIAEWKDNGHKNVLTPACLKELAELIGYTEVIFNGRDNSVSRLVPLEYRPDPNDRPENGNIFADLIK